MFRRTLFLRSNLRKPVKAVKEDTDEPLGSIFSRYGFFGAVCFMLGALHMKGGTETNKGDDDKDKSPEPKKISVDNLKMYKDSLPGDYLSYLMRMEPDRYYCAYLKTLDKDLSQEQLEEISKDVFFMVVESSSYFDRCKAAYDLDRVKTSRELPCKKFVDWKEATWWITAPKPRHKMTTEEYFDEARLQETLEILNGPAPKPIPKKRIANHLLGF